MAYHPEVQHAVAQMALTYDPIDSAHRAGGRGLVGTASTTARPGPSKIVSAKHHAVEACWRIVDLAMEVSGGAGMFKGNELERLFRDARCGRFHPANAALVA